MTRKGQLTAWGQEKALNHLFRHNNGGVSPTSTLYLALSSKALGTFTRLTSVAEASEIATSGYVRKEFVASAPVESSGAKRIGNDPSVQYNFSEDPPTINYCFLVTTPSGDGDIVSFWELDPPKTPTAIEPFSTPIDGITFIMD